MERSRLSEISRQRPLGLRRTVNSLREEMGCTFISFASKGLIEVDKAFVRLLDAPALERVLRER